MNSSNSNPGSSKPLPPMLVEDQNSLEVITSTGPALLRVSDRKASAHALPEGVQPAHKQDSLNG